MSPAIASIGQWILHLILWILEIALTSVALWVLLTLSEHWLLWLQRRRMWSVGIEEAKADHLKQKLILEREGIVQRQAALLHEEVSHHKMISSEIIAAKEMSGPVPVDDDVEGRTKQFFLADQKK